MLSKCTLALTVTLASLGALSCSSDDSSSSAPTPVMCNEDPWSCPAGQTCWAEDTSGSTFKCLNSGAGDVGEACQGIVGQPECKDGLTCSLLAGRPRVCTPYCELTTTEHACPTDYLCVKGMTQGGKVLQLCSPPAEGPDGGTPEGGAETGSPEDGGDASVADGEVEDGGTDAPEEAGDEAAADSGEAQDAATEEG